jgi:DtxR family Mn-dependent transcriptional regulator
MNHPAKDPHGEVIPDAHGFRAPEDDRCLALAEPGTYMILRVTSNNRELLAYLQKLGLLPTQTLSVLDRAPFDGPLKLLLTETGSVCHIGLDVAKHVFVSSMKQGGKSRSNRRRRTFESSRGKARSSSG